MNAQLDQKLRQELSREAEDNKLRRHGWLWRWDGTPLLPRLKPVKFGRAAKIVRQAQML